MSESVITWLIGIIITVVLGLLSLVVAASIPIIGFVINRIFKQIEDVKKDAKVLVDDHKTATARQFDAVETRRLEGHTQITTLVNVQLEAIKNGLNELKEELRNIYPGK